MVAMTGMPFGPPRLHTKKSFAHDANIANHRHRQAGLILTAWHGIARKTGVSSLILTRFGRDSTRRHPSPVAEARLDGMAFEGSQQLPASSNHPRHTFQYGPK